MMQFSTTVFVLIPMSNFLLGAYEWKQGVDNPFKTKFWLLHPKPQMDGSVQANGTTRATQWQKNAHRDGGKKFHEGESLIFKQSPSENFLNKEFRYTMNGAGLTWHIDVCCVRHQYVCSIFVLNIFLLQGVGPFENQAVTKLIILVWQSKRNIIRR